MRLLRLTLLLAPSALLVPLLALELYLGGARHVLLHTLVGWDVALIGLLLASYYGQPAAAWDGLALLALATWANMPDLLLIQGTYHHDWMDLFLFHIALDEIITLALPALLMLWLGLLGCYLRYRRPADVVR